MDTENYPGKGLSLSQLVFALNKELRSAAYAPSFTLDAISQLDQDTSAALATIREWKNSFVHINRIPLDILSLIPTYLSSQKDRFRASFVCRHWREAFLQHGAIWSELSTGIDKTCIATLLERAKGSALDVTVNGGTPTETVALFPTQQIRYLTFPYNFWEDIIAFSETGSGLFPLLRILEVDSAECFDPQGQLKSVTPPSRPFFKGADDLDKFVLQSDRLQLLSHFVFPSLTTFELLTSPVRGSNVSDLLDFFKASPMLQTVNVNVNGGTALGTIPRGTVVVLPNVKHFSLRMRDYIDDTGTQVYDIAASISCPRAWRTSLVHDMRKHNMTPDLEVFPAPTPWTTIVHQYTASPVELVTLEIELPEHGASMTCDLVFVSSDMTTVKLGLEVFGAGDQDMTSQEMGCEVFSQAHSFIRSHPQLSHIKQLHVKYRTLIKDPALVLPMADEVGKLFGSMGPLDELSIEGCDIRVYLGSILDIPEFDFLDQKIVFPPIKDLTILHPSIDDYDDEEDGDLNGVVDLAESQHALGIPFERVEVYAEVLPEGMAEKLRQWVGVVNCREGSLEQ